MLGKTLENTIMNNIFLTLKKCRNLSTDLKLFFSDNEEKAMPLKPLKSMCDS